MATEEGHVAGQAAGHLAQAPLAVHVERVAGLDLHVGDPGPQRLAAA